MILCLILFNGFAVQETITTPLVTDTDHRYTDSFDWDVKGAYLLFAASGLLSVLAFLVIHHTEKFIGDRYLLAIGFASGAVGWFIMLDFETRQIELAPFLIGYALVSVSFPINRNVCFTILSNVLGPNRAGGYMGWMLAIGAISRMLGPYWAIKSLSLSIKACFGGTAVLFFVGLALLVMMWKSCDRHPFASKSITLMFFVSPTSMSP